MCRDDVKPALVRAFTTGRLDMEPFAMVELGPADFRVYVENTATYGDPDEVTALVVMVARGLRVHLSSTAVCAPLIDASSAHP